MKGGHCSSGRQRDDPRNKYNISSTNYHFSKSANNNIIHLPTSVTENQLASVGLRTRNPDRFELCPAGFLVLENKGNSNATVGRPRGRGRGRPRSTKRTAAQRGDSDGLSVADTTHRRKTSSRKKRCAELQGKFEDIDYSDGQHSQRKHRL